VSPPTPSQHRRTGVRPILVAGGANLDRVARCLAPLAMASSNPVAVAECFGGVARNVAENLARLGLRVRLLTAVGDDLPGAALLSHARRQGVDPRGSLSVKGASTGTYTALLRRGGELVVGMADMAVMARLGPGTLRRALPRRAAPGTVVADLNLPRATVAALAGRARRAGGRLVVVAVSEPKMDRLPRSLRGVAALILNAGELGARVGRPLAGRAAVAAACLEVLDQGAEGVVVTLGRGGVTCCDASRRPHHLPALRARVVDVTGAGDAFAAGVVASLEERPVDLLGACRAGQRLAALTLASRASVAPGLGPAALRRGRSRRRIHR
jgi:pseudouridine kinase